MTPKPTVGRIVLYSPTGRPGPPAQWAAIVTRVRDNGCIDLCAFAPGGAGIAFTNKAEAGVPTPGRWTWPPRDP